MRQKATRCYSRTWSTVLAQTISALLALKELSKGALAKEKVAERRMDEGVEGSTEYLWAASHCQT